MSAPMTVARGRGEVALMSAASESAESELDEEWLMTIRAPSELR